MRASEEMVAEQVVVDLGAEFPSVELQSVTRRYVAREFGLVYKIFGVLGGYATQERYNSEGWVPGDDDDDDDFDDDLVSDREERILKTRVAVDDISAQFRGAGGVALVGPPGSGKSVLLKMIGGLMPPSAGRVVTRGVVGAFAGPTARALPRSGKVRRVLPIMANLMGLPWQQVKHRMHEIAELYGDPEVGDLHIAAVQGKNTKNLLLATMLSLDPDIIVLDDAIGEDDFGKRCRAKIYDLMENGSLVFVASKEVGNVSWVADHFVFLDNGKVVHHCSRGEYAEGSSTDDPPRDVGLTPDGAGLAPTEPIRLGPRPRHIA